MDPWGHLTTSAFAKQLKAGMDSAGFLEQRLKAKSEEISAKSAEIEEQLNAGNSSLAEREIKEIFGKFRTLPITLCNTCRS